MKHLIFIAILVSVAFVSADHPPKEVFAEMVRSCAESSGTSQEFIDKLFNHDVNFSDHKGWCFEKCLCPKVGLCDSDLKISEEKIYNNPKIPTDKAKEFLPGCNELKDEDDCVTIEKRWKCLFEKVPEMATNKPFGAVDE